MELVLGGGGFLADFCCSQVSDIILISKTDRARDSLDGSPHGIDQAELDGIFDVRLQEGGA